MASHENKNNIIVDSTDYRRLFSRGIFGGKVSRLGLFPRTVRMVLLLALSLGSAAIALLPALVLADFGTIGFTSSTPANVNNLGQSFEFAGGIFTGIRVATPSNSEFDIKQCGTANVYTDFHLDMSVNSICSPLAYWTGGAAGGQHLGDNDYYFTFASSSLATSTVTFDKNKTYVIEWISHNAGLACNTPVYGNVPLGQIFSEGSPNNDDNIGGCQTFPFVLVTQGISPTGDNTISLNIPADGQVIADFKYWTVSAATILANALIKVSYYDEYGGYFTDTVNGAFSTSTNWTANYIKQNILHPGKWAASARLVSSEGGVIASSPWITFTITGASVNTYIIPPELQGCSATSSYSVWNLGDWKCVIFQTWSTAIDSISNTFKAGGDAIKNLVLSTFPISVFHQLNADFAVIASTTPASTHNIEIPGFRNGSTIVLISSSTVGHSGNILGLDFRDILSKFIWFLVGIIILAQSILIVFLMMNKNKENG